MKSKKATDWTMKGGKSNSSDKYEEIVRHVERLIKSEAHSLFNGGTYSTARLIVSHLAFVHGLRPERIAQGNAADRAGAEKDGGTA